MSCDYTKTKTKQAFSFSRVFLDVQRYPATVGQDPYPLKA